MCIVTMQSNTRPLLPALFPLFHICIEWGLFWVFFLRRFRRNFLSGDDAEFMVKLLGLSAVLHGQQYGWTRRLWQVLNKKKVFTNRTFWQQTVLVIIMLNHHKHADEKHLGNDRSLELSWDNKHKCCCFNDGAKKRNKGSYR